MDGVKRQMEAFYPIYVKAFYPTRVIFGHAKLILRIEAIDQK